jgi:hypothetical protein
LQKQIDELKIQKENPIIEQKNDLKGSNQIENKPIEQSKEKAVQSFGQCKAITKKGSRCSRSAKSNGFCFQHGGE